MTSTRKKADVRRKELELALSRIKLGRARTGADKVSVAAVAREAGVSTSLIHNHYPDIAESIRTEQGRSSRAYGDAKRDELRVEREKNHTLREECDGLREKVARLASINEMLLSQNRVLKAQLDSPNVTRLPSRKR